MCQLSETSHGNVFCYSKHMALFTYDNEISLKVSMEDLPIDLTVHDRLRLRAIPLKNLSEGQSGRIFSRYSTGV